MQFITLISLIGLISQIIINNHWCHLWDSRNSQKSPLGWFPGVKLGDFSEKNGLFWKKTSIFEKKVRFFLVVQKIAVPLHRFWRQRAVSAVGSEHLPYKQRVGGSNPSLPTNRAVQHSRAGPFLCIFRQSLWGLTTRKTMKDCINWTHMRDKAF